MKLFKITQKRVAEYTKISQQALGYGLIHNTNNKYIAKILEYTANCCQEHVYDQMLKLYNSLGLKVDTIQLQDIEFTMKPRDCSLYYKIDDLGDKRVIIDCSNQQLLKILEILQNLQVDRL